MRKWELYTFLHSERNDFSSSLYLSGLHFHLQPPPPPTLHLWHAGISSLCQSQ